LRATHTPGRRLTPGAESAAEDGTVIGFKGSQAGFEELATRHDNDVEACRDLVMPENFPYQPFSEISLDGAAELFRRRDAQAAPGLAVGQGEDRAEPTMDPRAVIVYLLKLAASPNPLIAPKVLVGLQVAVHCDCRRSQLGACRLPPSTAIRC